MERHKRIVAASLAVALLLAACSDGDGAAEGVQPIEEPQADPGEPEPDPVDEDPEPEVEPAPDAEPEPADIDITVVPDEITEEYVEAVLAELERLYSEAYVAFREAGEPTIEVTDNLGSAFTDRQHTARLAQFVDLQEMEFEGFQSSPDAGPRRHSVEKVLDQGEACIYAETLMDLKGILVDPPEPEITFVELGPLEGDRVRNLSTTPWVIHALPVGDSGQLREVRPCQD